MEAYSINAVEQLTGVRAHTLRIWEKRYQSLIPHRTATNIRYYDGEQVRKLLNISALQQQGYKISALMGMGENEINALILGLAEDDGISDLHDMFVKDLIEYMLVFDEAMFDKTCSSAIVKYGIQEAILKVVYPFLRKTGILWRTNNAVPGQEHFASNIIKRKLLTAIDGVRLPQYRDKTFVLFLPPDEWHEIGLLLADFMIRNAGYGSIYLGQNVPFESLQTAVRITKPTHLLTFFASGFEIGEQLKKLSALAGRTGKPKILVNCVNKPAGQSKHIVFLQSPADLQEHLKSG